MLNKKEIEKEVVKRFLNNNGKSFDDKEIINVEEDDIVDIIFKEKKFQITVGDHKLVKIRHTLPKNTIKFLPSRCPDDIFANVLSVIKDKNEKYGKSAKEIILLISLDFDYSEPFWLKNTINNYRICGWDYNFNFDEIYLVCPHENIKIHP